MKSVFEYFERNYKIKRISLSLKIGFPVAVLVVLILSAVIFTA